MLDFDFFIFIAILTFSLCALTLFEKKINLKIGIKGSFQKKINFIFFICTHKCLLSDY